MTEVTLKSTQASVCLQIGIISIFPAMFAAISEFGIIGRAIRQNLLQLHFCNPRDYAFDIHRSVDDRPYGGGPGMLMKVAPLAAALAQAKQMLPAMSPVIYLTPQGQPLNQEIICQLAQNDSLLLIAGRYEGIDQRFIDHSVDQQYSLGDYVLSGGELPAMVLIDAITRWRPQVLNDQRSAVEDSFVDGLLDYPHYTRPAIFQDQTVPEVLLTGNHEQIRRWRLKQSLGLTWRQRPDLIAQKSLTSEEQLLLREYVTEYVAETSYGGA